MLCQICCCWLDMLRTVNWVDRLWILHSRMLQFCAEAHVLAAERCSESQEQTGWTACSDVILCISIFVLWLVRLIFVVKCFVTGHLLWPLFRMCFRWQAQDRIFTRHFCWTVTLSIFCWTTDICSWLLDFRLYRGRIICKRKQWQHWLLPGNTGNDGIEEDTFE